jgi:hypothetical protein
MPGFSGQTQTDSKIQGLWKKHMQPQQGGVSKNVILSYIIRIIPFPNNHFNRDTDNQPVLITWGWSPLFKQPQVGDPQSDCQELRSRVLSSIVYFNGVTAGATRHRCILCFLFLYICIYNFIIYIYVYVYAFESCVHVWLSIISYRAMFPILHMSGKTLCENWIRFPVSGRRTRSCVVFFCLPSPLQRLRT